MAGCELMAVSVGAGDLRGAGRQYAYCQRYAIWQRDDPNRSIIEFHCGGAAAHVCSGE